MKISSHIFTRKKENKACFYPEFCHNTLMTETQLTFAFFKEMVTIPEILSPDITPCSPAWEFSKGNRWLNGC